jgi:hypothetical protein
LVILPILIFAQMNGVQLTASVSPRTVYVGQQVSYDGAMQVSAQAGANFQSNPEYTPPDVRGATVYDFPFDTNSIRSVRVNGLIFQQFSYHRALFPLAPGTYTISPATLVYSLPDPRDPYVEKSYTLHSPPQTFTVLALPDVGRPEDFKGAVGQFTIKTQVSSKALNAGESFTLTAVVDGSGNLELLPRPNLDIPWATVVNGPERAHWDSSGVLVHGTKTFQWVVNPRNGGDLVVPPVHYSYFDPAGKRYVTVPSAPISVTVAASSDVAPEGAIGPSSSHDAESATTPFPYIVGLLRSNIALVAGLIGIAIAVIVVLTLKARRNDEELE